MKKRNIHLTILGLFCFLFLSMFLLQNCPDEISPDEIILKNEVEEEPLCKNFLNASDFVSSKNVSNSEIVIVATVGDSNDYDDYMIALDSVKCYASHMGYNLHLLNLTENLKAQKRCKHTDFFFKRHCALALFMKENMTKFKYILYIDADMGVINPCHRIQDFMDDNDKTEIIFYERFFNYEFAAGSFLIRNSEFSRAFLRFWADYNYRLPNSFHGTDNGALHQVLMVLHFPDLREKFQCWYLWNRSKRYDDLFEFEACTKHALYLSADKFVNGTIKIIRKLSPGWVRDGWLTNSKWSFSDFMLHGWKKSLALENFKHPFVGTFDLLKCGYNDLSFSNFKYIQNLVSTKEEIQEILRIKTDFTHQKYMNILKYLNILCGDGSEPVNEICNKNQ